MPRMQLPEKLQPLIDIPKRIKIVIGGRGSGKSQSIVDINLMESQTKALKIGCFREFQNSIEDSVYSLLVDEILRLELSGFSVLANKITNCYGGEFKFRGLARNPEAMKSMNGFHRFLVEEAQTISKESLKLLLPTLRTDDSEIWMAANPMSSADPFSERFIIPFERELERDGYYEDDMHLIIVCNYMDNPFFPSVLEQERLFDKEHLSTAEYEHIWLGKFNDEVDGSIIPVEWFDTAIDSHITLGFQPEGEIVVSHDPSDLGPDPKGLCYKQGSVVLDVLENAKGDGNDGADWATDFAIEVNADRFIWDCDGMGVLLRRQISESLAATEIEFEMFRGSNSPLQPSSLYQPDPNIDRKKAKTNAQTFKNRRAQSYFSLRDRFYCTFKAIKNDLYAPDIISYISISSTIKARARLRSEVCRIPKKKNPNGMLQIMTKDEMLRIHKIKSPNMADSLMMAFDIQESGVDGSYYAKIIEKLRTLGRIGNVPHEQHMPTDTFWEIGDDDTVSIWFVQQRGSEKRLIDFYQNQGEGIAHYVMVIKEKNYLLGAHYMPHKEQSGQGVQMGKRTIDVVGNIGLSPIIRVNRAKNQDELQAGILNVRNFLMQCWIDEEKCMEGLSQLINYRKEWDDKNSVHKKTPLSDWCAPGANSLRNGVMGLRNRTNVATHQVMPEPTEDF